MNLSSHKIDNINYNFEGKFILDKNNIQTKKKILLIEFINVNFGLKMRLNIKNNSKNI